MSKLGEILTNLDFQIITAPDASSTSPFVDKAKLQIVEMFKGICFESDEPGSEISLRSFDEIKEAIDEL